MVAPPNDDELALLTTIERASFLLGDLVNRRFSGVAQRWNAAFMGATIWTCGGNRLRVHGLERIAHLTRHDRILAVANHRSYFDFFVVSAVVFWRTRLSRRILFPVRSSFFYDHPLGPLVNATMSAMAMFPPILRDRERAAWNQYSLQRCIDELSLPGTVLGFHPEGTRNKSDDPYALLPAKPGVGKVALEMREGAYVVPFFVLGMTNDLARETRVNWLVPDEHPIDVVIGAPVDLSDLRRAGSDPHTQRQAAERCLAAIRALADEHRALAAGRAPVTSRRSSASSTA